MSRYVYSTPLGDPPNNGVPPGMEPPVIFGGFGPGFGGSCGFGSQGPAIYPGGPFPLPFPMGPGAPPCTGCPPPPPPPYPGGPCYAQQMYSGLRPAHPQDPPPAYHIAYQHGNAFQPPTIRNAPPSGGRVNGQTPRFRDGSGYIFPKDNTKFLIIEGDCRPWEMQGQRFGFNEYHCATYMPIEEFIQQVDALKKAPDGTRWEDAGITEAIYQGGGKWVKGATYLNGERCKLYHELSDGTEIPKTLLDAGWLPHDERPDGFKGVTIFLEPGRTRR